MVVVVVVIVIVNVIVVVNVNGRRSLPYGYLMGAILDEATFNVDH